jgi:hypothetical protein
MSISDTNPLTPIGCLVFEGRQVVIQENDTIAACLLRAGILATRQTRSGQPRGVFCGIGVCHDCLVIVDGVPNVRACMTLARPGSIVARGG